MRWVKHIRELDKHDVKMEAIKRSIYSFFNNNKIQISHMLAGIVIFYFLIHPLTMVIYWFEFHGQNHPDFTFANLFVQRILHSFSFHMTGMSSIFLSIGIATGLGSGMYYNRIRKKNILLIKQEEFIKRDIGQVILQGENEFTEFKSSIRYDYCKKIVNKELETAIAKSICGFMNTWGGKLIIGISDKGEILGLENDYSTLKHKNRDGFERRVYEIISDHLGTEFCLDVHIYFHSRDNKDICTLDIGQSRTPVYQNEGKTPAFYVRTGNATVPLTIKETVNYLKLIRHK